MGVHVDRIERLAGGHEEAVSFHAAETEVRAGFGQMDFADRIAIGREDIHTIEAFSGPAVGAP